MQVATWKDRIGDGSNLWLNALRMEDDGDFSSAVVLYLEDATGYLEKDMRARAALGCACAANCLEKVGNMNRAKSLYFEAARLYEEAATSAFGESIREALWLLREAHEYFILGGDEQRATEIYDRYVSLTRKVNPFRSHEPDGFMRTMNAAEKRAMSTRAEAQTSEVNNAIDDFLRLGDKAARRRARESTALGGIPLKRSSDEQSIVS